MASVEKLNVIKKDVISSLSKDKLKQYIFYLTKRYYETYVDCDEESFNNTLDQLTEIIEEYRETYINLLGFIFFCLYLNANVMITKESENNSFSMTNIFTYDLIEDEDFEDDLSHDIKEIFNKERIKERYYEKSISQFIE